MDLRPKRMDLRPERLDLRPERLDLRPERLDLTPERPDLRPERRDLRPERLDLRPERLEKLWGGTYVRTDGRKEIHPCDLQDIGPLGRCPKSIMGKNDSNHYPHCLR